jgi:hypothetical protein
MTVKVHFKEIKVIEIADKEIIKQISEKHVSLPNFKRAVANADFIECHVLHDYTHLSLHKEGLFFLVDTKKFQELLAPGE